MITPNRFGFLTAWQAWAVLGMGVLTAIFTQQSWVLFLGIIGFLLTLLFELVSGGSLEHSSAVRLARTEQENRSLRAEQARLMGGVKELQTKCAALEAEIQQLQQAKAK